MHAPETIVQKKRCCASHKAKRDAVAPSLVLWHTPADRTFTARTFRCSGCVFRLRFTPFFVFRRRHPYGAGKSALLADFRAPRAPFELRLLGLLLWSPPRLVGLLVNRAMTRFVAFLAPANGANPVFEAVARHQNKRPRRPAPFLTLQARRLLYCFLHPFRHLLVERTEAPIWGRGGFQLRSKAFGTFW